MKFLKLCFILNIVLGFMWVALIFNHPKSEPVRTDSFDSVYSTLEAITYTDINGKRYLRYDLEQTALMMYLTAQTLRK